MIISLPFHPFLAADRSIYSVAVPSTPCSRSIYSVGQAPIHSEGSNGAAPLQRILSQTMPNDDYPIDTSFQWLYDNHRLVTVGYIKRTGGCTYEFHCVHAAVHDRLRIA
jgi:hypothetical protein